jgi:hypothetical protein
MEKLFKFFLIFLYSFGMVSTIWWLAQIFFRDGMKAYIWNKKKRYNYNWLLEYIEICSIIASVITFAIIFCYGSSILFKWIPDNIIINLSDGEPWKISTLLSGALGIISLFIFIKWIGRGIHYYWEYNALAKQVNIYLELIENADNYDKIKEIQKLTQDKYDKACKEINPQILKDRLYGALYVTNERLLKVENRNSAKHFIKGRIKKREHEKVVYDKWHEELDKTMVLNPPELQERLRAINSDKNFFLKDKHNVFNNTHQLFADTMAINDKNISEGKKEKYRIDGCITQLSAVSLDNENAIYAAYKGTYHGGCTHFYLADSDDEIEIIEYLSKNITFKITTTGLIEAFYIVFELNKNGRFWHSFYGYDYQFIFSFKTLVNYLIDEMGLKPNTKELSFLKNIFPSFRVSSINRSYKMSCISYQANIGIVDKYITLDSNGKIQTWGNNTLKKTKCKTYY